MSLAENLRRNFQRKNVAMAEFSIAGQDYGDGSIYLQNGYYGIYQAAYGGLYSPLGIRINEDRALTLSTFLSGVKLISEDVGSLPCFVNERTPAGQDVAPAHPLYSLLHDSPNPDTVAIQFRESITAHMLMTGVGYARIERSKSDSKRIIALWLLMPGDVVKQRDQMNRPVYRVTEGQFNGTTMAGVAKTYSAADIFQVPGFGLTGQDGLNILQYARNTLGLALAQEEYASRFFSQDQTPNLVLKHPGKLGPQGVKGVREAWADSGRGTGKQPADNWHAPRVLQEGMDVTQLTPKAQDAQLVEQRTYQILEVARLLRLPPHKLAEMGRATWNNISSQNTQYYNETLRPILVRWEQACNLWLLGSDPKFFVEHEIAGMLRGDFATQTAGFRTLLAAGVYSINEVRGYLNLNSIGPSGDEHFIQVNQGTVQELAAGIYPAGSNPASDAQAGKSREISELRRTVESMSALAASKDRPINVQVNNTLPSGRKTQRVRRDRSGNIDSIETIEE